MARIQLKAPTRAEGIYNPSQFEAMIAAAHAEHCAGQSLSRAELQWRITQLVRNDDPSPGTARWALLAAYRRERDRINRLPHVQV